MIQTTASCGDIGVIVGRVHQGSGRRVLRGGRGRGSVRINDDWEVPRLNRHIIGCILIISFKIINGLIFRKRLGYNWHICKRIIRFESANSLMPVAEPTPNVNIKSRLNKHTFITSLSRKPFFSYHPNRMFQYHLLCLQVRVKYPKQSNNPVLINSVQWLRVPGVLQSWVVEMNNHIWEV